MALDVYEPCPCGSGKKLKFCCPQIADDMERVSRLIENNQSRQALHLLEQLDKKHPKNPWICTSRSLVLLESGEPGTARDVLAQVLQAHPDHDLAIVLYATAMVQADGLDLAKKAIHRAFQRSAKKFPSMVGGLAGAMAAVYQSRGHMLAAREHLALAMRFVPDQERQDIFVRLLEFDHEASIPYPLRSVHPLPALNGNEAFLTESKKGLKYAFVGCWNTAADIFEKLAQSQPSAELWHAVGLCRAWDGDEPAAAAALHQAAKIYPETGLAVECETLAQLLDWNGTSHRIYRHELTGEVSSLSRLLTQLDQSERLFRVELPPAGTYEGRLPAAVYQVLDRQRSEMAAPSDVSLENMVHVLGMVTLEDRDAETQEPALITVEAMVGPKFDETVSLLKQVAADLVDWDNTSEEAGWIPAESATMSWQWAWPTRTPPLVRRRLQAARWQQIAGEEWFNIALAALDGRTPRQAAGDPSSAVALTAAAYVFDSQCLRGGYELDLDALLASLGLSPLPPMSVTPETSLKSFTPLQWLRLPLEQLSDEQLSAVVNRALLVHHDRFLYRVLKLAVSRPQCLTGLDQARIYQTLAELCRSHERRAETYQWIQAGRTHASTLPNSFERVWSWDLRELMTRLEDPHDPELRPLVDRIIQYYGPKLPQLRMALADMLDAAGLDPNWVNGGLVTGSTAAVSPRGSGLWTPETAAAAPSSAAGSGSLWLPGQ
jgi:tetratricopeptide (TPR) repeat protein